MNRPPPGSMVYWKAQNAVEWRFGYCTYVSGPDIVRMGRWNGDTTGGSVVSTGGIQWKPY